jgi:outer membrane protein OmpA-like peptidoglycan-associated protein
MTRRDGVSVQRNWKIGIAGLWVNSILLALGPTNAALAQNPTVEEIIGALTSGTLRAAVSAEHRRQDADESRLIARLRNRTARSITAKERDNVNELAKYKPSIDIEIAFDYNSAGIGPRAMRPLLALGRALSNDQLKGATFFVNGHTDAKGGIEYNQDLSERRAEAVKRVLIEDFKLPKAALIAIGFGKSQLKNPADPFGAENRRVQIVNTDNR